MLFVFFLGEGGAAHLENVTVILDNRCCSYAPEDDVDIGFELVDHVDYTGLFILKIRSK